MKDLLLSLQSEFYKSRKTLGFWSVIILPVVVCLLVAAGFYLFSAKLDKLPSMVLWMQFSGILLSIVSGMWLVMMVIFVCYSVNSIEHKADSWKTLFSLPVSKWSVYSAKLIYASLLMAIYLSLFLVLTVVLGNLLGMLKPGELHFADYHMEGLLTQRYIKLYLSSLGIISIQFLLSLLWANFLKPMGVGFICTILGSIAAGLNWKYAYLFPYASPSLTTRNSMPRPNPGAMNTTVDTTVDIFTDNIYVSLIVFAVIFVAGFYIVQKKSVK
jgi:lantibiotic transport system permease protein